MAAQIPHYYDPEKKVKYVADSCKPLRNAWKSGNLELAALVRGTYPGIPLGKGELPGVRSIGYWNIKQLQDWGLEWHTNEGIEICFLESGHLDFLLRDQVHMLQTDDINITRPWIIHKLGAPNVSMSKLYWLILDVGVRHPHQEWHWPDWILLNKDDLNDLTRCLRQNEQPVWKAGPELRNCFRQIGRVLERSPEGSYDSMLKIQINSLLINLLEMFREGNISLDHSLTGIKRTVGFFLDSLESKLDLGWTVRAMAENCNLGVTRFTHYCREISNCTPMEYLNRLRIRKAAGLIAEQRDILVGDVGYICGFTSVQYFNFVFKKQFGMSPGQYRKQKGTENKPEVSELARNV